MSGAPLPKASPTGCTTKTAAMCESLTPKASSSMTTTPTRKWTPRRQWDRFLTGGATGIVVGTGYYYAGASDTDKVLAFDARLVPAWSETLDGCTESSPGLVSINGQLDVVEGTDQGPANCGGTSAGSVWLLDGQDGTPLCHTPVASRVIGSVVAADLTGDGQPELLVPTIHGVEVLTDACQEVTVLGPDLGFQNSPLVTDDPNGTTGITVAGYNGNNQGVIQHYEIPGSDGALAVGVGRGPCSTMTRP